MKQINGDDNYSLIILALHSNQAASFSGKAEFVAHLAHPLTKYENTAVYFSIVGKEQKGSSYTQSR